MYQNKMNGYAPQMRSSGNHRVGGWGMSHSLPSGMSHFAYDYQHLQDADFSQSYPIRPSRRYYDMASGSKLGGRNISSSTSSLYGGESSGTNLIINYLPQDMTDGELYALFQPIGPIESCRIMRDLKSGYSFGYAFINYVTENAAQRAVQSLNGVTVRNKRLKVSYARPQGEALKDTNLYVTNLPKTITEENLDIIFGKYGTIVQKNILRDKLTGRPRGVAFIRFGKREEAQEAISALNNVIPEGGNQPLTVRVAEDHGKLKAPQYMQMFNNSGNPMNRGRNRFRFSNMCPY